MTNVVTDDRRGNVSAPVSVPKFAGTVPSGDFIPTLIAVANCSALAVQSAFLSRVGNEIEVCLRISGTATAATTLTKVGISLPIGKDVSQTYDVIGHCTNLTSNPHGGYVQGDTANDRAEAGFMSVGAGSAFALNVTFKYRIP